MIKFLLILFTIAISLPVRAGPVKNAKSEGAIRKLIASFAEARNAFDWDALSDMYAEDAEYADPWDGAPIKGRANLKAYWSRMGAYQSGGFLERTVNNIRFIKPDVAVAQVDIHHFMGAKSGAINYNETLVIVKKARMWQVVTQSAMIPEGESLKMLAVQAELANPRLPTNVRLKTGEVGKLPPGWNVPTFVLDAGYTAKLQKDDCPDPTSNCVFFKAPDSVIKVKAAEFQQSFWAGPYLGKYIRFRALLRAQKPGMGDVEIRMGVRHVGGGLEFFDSIDGPVKSAVPQWREVIGHVSPDAVTISIWARYHPSGPAWISLPSFEIVK